MVTPSIIVHVTALLRSPLLDRIKYIKPLNAANQLPQPDRCCTAGSGLRPKIYPGSRRLGVVLSTPVTSHL